MLQVVAAVLERDGRVLIAQRKPGQSHPLQWEFPGGKVEPGETDRQAAVRELREELGVEAEIGTPLGQQPMGERYLLRVYTGRITAGEPVLREHAELRWLGPAELDDVDWLDADRPFLQPVRRYILRASAGRQRFGDD
jgi:8-oxo-dGTP diphosphatase